MRFKSPQISGYTVVAVTGINTVSFAIDFRNADTAGLLGFAVERHDKKEEERYFIKGFKVFKEFDPNPSETVEVSTFDQPVQSFAWEDFTAKSGYEYDYYFYPLKGKPKNLDRSAQPIKITVQTEELYDPNSQHDVFFNRGVASSQAYIRRFGYRSLDYLKPAKKREAKKWLTRDLKTALLKFIKQAEAGEHLYACVYEFHHPGVVEAFKDAIDKGVNVKIIIDAKNNPKTDTKGKLGDPFPKQINLDTIKAAGISLNHIILRQSNKSNIQHNKFIVYAGTNNKTVAVWTGSTNISDGGIYGQTNVGHWIKNADVADKFLQYWNILKDDPGGKEGNTIAENKTLNKEFKEKVIALQADIEHKRNKPFDRSKITANATTAVFSPRTSNAMMEVYAKMMDACSDCACITLAFGINKRFKSYLVDNTNNNHICFFLLEKKDKASEKNKDTFVTINASHNVYKAWGSYFKDPLYQWVKETSTKSLKLNRHVMYIHSKFMLLDPLSNDPVVVTGSANFSDNSTSKNDENMVIIRGDKRVADIYFTEFMRLFNHYYFRSVIEDLRDQNRPPDQGSIFLASKAEEWLKKYEPGTFKTKRIEMMAKLEGVV
ncbi:MAG: phospholipase D-like domain-containing protein [Chitinophagaceae bacterium]